MRVWPGSPLPLGATWDGEGVNFALFSEHAAAVELCLFSAGGEEEARIRLPERTSAVWHGYLPGVRPGRLYGYRVHGPWAPDEGHLFNPHKLLVDPYAKALCGPLQWSDELYGHQRGGDPLGMDPRDSAPFVPKSVIVDTASTWGDDRSPAVPWSRTVLYECHVKGMTARHPDVAPRLRGTYLGLASEPVLEHLLSLGVTAVELLPVHQSISERFLVERGLSNYWGYNTLGFFAPDARFATGDRGEQVEEFKTMVKAFHRVGIEVILDVVYNHTCEGGADGPSLSFRGIDNRSYYRLGDGVPPRYVDTTGCGNAVRVEHPRVLQMVLDSMRYWVTEMHVDGFRLDLAVALGRDPDEFRPDGRFFGTIRQDPVLSRIKLIAEPWDLGEGGYRLGGFPPGWAEWNGQYRDTVRRFWRGDAGLRPVLASRLAGSSDVFVGADRGPFSGINLVTCHDGFTLADLVSYQRKHNEANGHDNHDGPGESHARNWGEEGPSERPSVQRTRERVRRSLLATLAFSQGVPMLSHGDEIGRTQRGNDNAYCQDNELSWMDWDLGARERELLAFARRVLAIRRGNPVFRRRRFFSGRMQEADGWKDVSWLRPEGGELQPDDWGDDESRAFGMLIWGEASDELDERGHPMRGQSLLMLLNGGSRARHFALPAMPEPGSWRELVNTGRSEARHPRTGGVSLRAHALILLAYEALS